MKGEGKEIEFDGWWNERFTKTKKKCMAVRRKS
jgi:hypothetical protein